MSAIRAASLLAFLFMIVFSAPAFALSGYTTANVNMRTGPGVRYARITVVPVGALVNIRQCLPARYWCRVYWRGFRGWVSRRYLRFGEYRPRIYGPPIIYFEYRDRRWHDDHDRWHRKFRYPKKRKKIDRRKWNKDHDRWHQQSRTKRKPLRSKRFVEERQKRKLRRRSESPARSDRVRRRKCPPGLKCD